MAHAGDSATYRTTVGSTISTSSQSWAGGTLGSESVLVQSSFDKDSKLTAKQYLQYPTATSMKMLLTEGFDSSSTKVTEATYNPNLFYDYPANVGQSVNYSTTALIKALGSTGTYLTTLIGSDTLTASVAVTIRYVGNESVTVPAGTFNACKFSIDSIYSNFSSALLGASYFPNVNTSYWSVAGVGTIKTTSVIGSTTSTVELVSGSFNGVSKP